jgi:hypothetical protein
MPRTELRECPVCEGMIDVDAAMMRGWKIKCPHCLMPLLVDCEEIGEELCVWFIKDEASAIKAR